MKCLQLPKVYVAKYQTLNQMLIQNGDATNLINTIEQVNMLPELIRMQCSMMGAWGKSTSSGKLLQLRTLDFGGGPFGNRTMLVVNHPETFQEILHLPLSVSQHLLVP